MPTHGPMKCDGEFRFRKFIKKEIFLKGKLILVIDNLPVRICVTCGEIKIEPRDILLAELYAVEMDTKGDPVEYEQIIDRYKGFIS